MGWNEFLDRYGRREYRDVDSAFQPAFLVYRYYSQVYNGGHLQFFLNYPMLPFEAVSEALTEIVGPDVARNFDLAVVSWRSWNPGPPMTSEEFVELAEEGSLEEFDQFVYEVEPNFDERLEAYLIERKLI